MNLNKLCKVSDSTDPQCLVIKLVVNPWGDGEKKTYAKFYRYTKYNAKEFTYYDIEGDFDDTSWVMFTNNERYDFCVKLPNYDEVCKVFGGVVTDCLNDPWGIDEDTNVNVDGLAYDLNDSQLVDYGLMTEELKEAVEINWGTAFTDLEYDESDLI